jgi:hypothetical protein
MKIGVVRSPRTWKHWNEAKAFLEPARARGDFPDVLNEPDDELFAVLDGDELLAVATAWFDADEKRVEVKLVGGKDRHKWLRELDDKIGAMARDAGAERLIAIGRRGWLKELRAIGWVQFGEVDAKTLIYSRRI